MSRTVSLTRGSVGGSTDNLVGPDAVRKCNETCINIYIKELRGAVTKSRVTGGERRGAGGESAAVDRSRSRVGTVGTDVPRGRRSDREGRWRAESLFRTLQPHFFSQPRSAPKTFAVRREQALLPLFR